MERAATVMTCNQYGVRMAARDIVINAMLAAVEKLDQGSKRVYSHPLISFFSATHPCAQGNAIHFRIVGSSNCHSGFRRELARICIAKPEIAEGRAVPENQAPIYGIDADFLG